MTSTHGSEQPRRLDTAAWLRRALFAGGLFVALAAAQSRAEDAADAPPGNEDHALSDVERQQRAMAGLAAVAGIAIIGIALGTLIILWAGRLRRITREPLPSSQLQNEFWFLKPPKPPVSEEGPERSSND